jgi:hypothetical protein
MQASVAENSITQIASHLNRRDFRRRRWVSNSRLFFEAMGRGERSALW